jgi:hypothetical protein
MRISRTLPAGLCCLALALACQTAARAQSQMTARAQSEAGRGAWRELLAFKNQNLHDLDAATQEKIDSLVNRVLPERNNGPKPSVWRLRRAWLLGEFKAARNRRRFVLLDSPAIFMAPGEAVHELYFFDKRGKLLNTQILPTGWRMLPKEATLTERGGGDARPHLIITASGMGGFAYAPFTRQYYALGNDEAVLVRLEGKDAEILRNSYGCRYPAVGPPVPRRDVEAWAAALASADEVEVLRALMWLGGQHREVEQADGRGASGEDGGPDKCPEAADDAKLYAQAEARGDIRRRLEHLAASPSQWIRQAAELTRTPNRERRFAAPRKKGARAAGVDSNESRPAEK